MCKIFLPASVYIFDLGVQVPKSAQTSNLTRSRQWKFHESKVHWLQKISFKFFIKKSILRGVLGINFTVPFLLKHLTTTGIEHVN